MWWGRPDPRQEVAAFDSATGILRALSRFLHHTDVPLLGQFPRAIEPVMSAVLTAANHLPRHVAEKAYAMSAWAEAVPARRIGDISSDALAEWIVGHYPRRTYPVVFIGSSGGALVHLAAALGAPWLPQTLLIPVRRCGGHPDEPRDALDRGRPAGEALLAANPDLVLHHMHDANQDRLMAAGAAGTLLAGRSRTAAVLSGAALLAASGSTRFGVFHVGLRSAEDPKYTVIPQRRRLDTTSGHD